MFLAAFTSALQAKPQTVHAKRAWLSRDLPSRCPHAEHRWLVNAGAILSTRLSALSSRRRTSRPHPDRRISRLSPAFWRTFRPGLARRHRARPAEPHPPGLRNPDLANVAGEAAHVPLLPAPPHHLESLVPAGLAPRRPPGWVARVEKRGRGLGEVPQRLLLYHLRARGQPGVLGAGGGELSTLFQVAGCALAAWVPVLVLLDREVPDVAGVSTMFPHDYFLDRGGKQSVSGHTNILTNRNDISGEVRRRFLPSQKAWAPTPRS